MKMRKLRIIVKKTGGYLAISRHENPQKSWENTTITVPPITEATYTEINGVCCLCRKPFSQHSLNEIIHIIYVFLADSLYFFVRRHPGLP